MVDVKNVNSPFMCYCQKVIPLYFDESMSYYEQLCNLYNYLKNEVMPAVNNNAEALKELQNLFVELRNYVDNYFTDLNIQNEINNKLDQMAEDGTLDKIINEHIFGELNNRVDYLEKDEKSFNYMPMRRIGRLLYENHIYDDVNPEFSPYQLQGNCYCKDNVMVLLLMDQTRSEDTKGRLIKLNLYNFSIMNTLDLEFVGHGNWVSYNIDNNEIYITRGTDKSIIVVDYDSFTTKNIVSLHSIIPVENDLSSFSYDNVTKKYYAFTYLNGFEINFPETDVLNTVSFDWEDTFYNQGLYDYKTQGCYAHNGKFYFTTLQPAGLVVFNNLGKIENKYNYPKIVNMYLTREIEEISPVIDNDNKFKFIVGTTGLTGAYAEENITQIFEMDLKKGEIDNYPMFQAPYDRDIYVNPNPSPLAYNPNGTKENPFKCINEAFDCAHTTLFNAITIHLFEGEYSNFALTNTKTKFITIEGDGLMENTLIRKGSANSGHLTLNNVTFKGGYNRFDHLLNGYKATLNLVNVDFIDDSNLLIKIALFSKLNYTNVTRNKVINYKQSFYDISAQTSECYAMKNAMLTDFIGESTMINPQSISGEISANDGVIDLSPLVTEIMTNGTVKKYQFVLTTGASSNQGFIQEVESTKGNDRYFLQAKRITPSNGLNIYEADLVINKDNKTITIENNKKLNIDSSGNVTVDTTSKDLRLLNIMISK